MNWQIRLARRARKNLDSFPQKDEQYILIALQSMRINPFNSDIEKLKNERSMFRRRVGNYRIFFDIYPDKKIVDIIEIRRRTSTTY